MHQLGGIRGVAGSRVLLSGYPSLMSPLSHSASSNPSSCHLSGTILCSNSEFQTPFLTPSLLPVLVLNSQEQKVTPTPSKLEPASLPNPLGEFQAPPFSWFTISRSLGLERNFFLLPLYLGTRGPWVFNTCGASGRSGPTQTQCDGAYTGSSVMVTVGAAGPLKGVQLWRVPDTGQYL